MHPGGRVYLQNKFGEHCTGQPDADGFALGFNSLNAIENHHAAIQDTQGALHFGSEIDVAGSVDQVDLIIFPFRGDGSRTMVMPRSRS